MLSIKSLSAGAASYYAPAAPDDAAPDATKRVDEYYSANVAEAPGRWWSPAGGLVPNGSEVRPGELKAALDGFGPDGTALVQNAGKADRTAGFDLAFSAPKSVSSLYAAAAPDARTELLEDMRTSAEAGLRALHEAGAFGARRGKGGAVREQARDVAVALFPQATSRAGQPQLHVHAVLANVAQRADGSTCALDARDVYPWKTYAGAVFRAELAHRMEGRGLAVAADGKVFKVAGVDPALERHWSARRAELLAGAAEMTGGAKLRGKRRLAVQQAAARATRGAKGAVPEGAALDARWQADMARHGHTPEAVWQGARAAAEGHQRPAGTAADAALREGFERGSVATERTLRRLLAEAAQTRGGGAEAVRQDAARLLADGRLVRLGENARGEAVFSTREALERERRILRNARDRRHERPVIRPEAVERAIARRAAGGKPLSAEQERAVRHVAGGGGVVAVEGLAGVGKSFAMAAVTEAARASGAEVRALAPSWQAAQVLSDDTGEQARALQGFVRRLDAGTERLDGRTVVVLDESGMASAGDVDRLLVHARQAGAQVIFVGDRRQLGAVEPGAAFAALADDLGVARMEAVRRQSEEWMRRASKAFGNGDARAGLAEYAARGRLLVTHNAEDARARVVEAWDANRRAHPEASRLVLAGRNADVHALNAELRQRRLDAGELGAEALTVRTLHTGGKGGSGEVRDMELRAGDRVALGAVNLTRDGRDVLPNDLATVRGFTASADPVLALRMDRTVQDVVVRLAELRPFAPDGEASTGAPALQHAYARTIHKSQGATVDYAFVLGGDGLDSSRAYVAATRHRSDVVLVADGGAIRERLLAEGKPGDAEAIRDAFLRAAAERRDGVNAADYIADKEQWLATGEVRAAHSRGSVPSVPGASARTTEGQTMVAGMGGAAAAAAGGGASAGAGMEAGASASVGQSMVAGLREAAMRAADGAPATAAAEAEALKQQAPAAQEQEEHRPRPGMSPG